MQQNSSMEEPKSLGELFWKEVFATAPHIPEKIFGESNNQNLAKNREVCKEWNDFLKNNKLYYWRIIKHYTNCSDELMKDLAKNLKDAKEIASNLVAIFKRFRKGTRQSNNYLKKWHDTPLHTAADNGDLKSYHLIMENVDDKNPSIHYKYNAEGGNGKTTPLHLAAKKGDFNVFKFIFNNVDDKNPKNNLENTPFHFAAENGHLSICQLIIARLKDKNPPGGPGKGLGFDYGHTPLHIAAANGHLDVCKLIVEAVGYVEKKANFVHHSHKLTPLDLAIQYKHIHVQRYLQIFQQPPPPVWVQHDLDAKRRKST